MLKEFEIDANMSVNTTIRRFPESVAVFNELGVDACCGGASSLAEAAVETGISLEKLLAALDKVVTADRAAS